MQVNGAFVLYPPSAPEAVVVHLTVSRWSSICREATMWGLEHSDFSNSALCPDRPTQSSTVTSRLSRYSYGMVFDQYYDVRLHHIDDNFWDVDTGSYMARDQMTWFLRR
ncbi:MAG: hypothetical protein L6R39_005597, partial [Caloplaca ligustica]